MKELRCPYCRSLLRYDGRLDFSAPAIQVRNCPVCNFPNWLATDYPLPILWVNPQVIEENKPLKPYTEVLPATLQKAPSAESQQPLYTWTTPDWMKNATSGLGNIGIWVVVVLALVLLIKWRR